MGLEGYLEIQEPQGSEEDEEPEVLQVHLDLLVSQDPRE